MVKEGEEFLISDLISAQIPQNPDRYKSFYGFPKVPEQIPNVFGKQPNLTREVLHRKEQILNVFCDQPKLTQDALLCKHKFSVHSVTQENRDWKKPPSERLMPAVFVPDMFSACNAPKNPAKQRFYEFPKVSQRVLNVLWKHTKLT